MRRRLGNPRHCIVGEFPGPEGTPGREACLDQDAGNILPGAIESGRGLPPMHPHNVDDIEYGITTAAPQHVPERAADATNSQRRDQRSTTCTGPSRRCSAAATSVSRRHTTRR